MYKAQNSNIYNNLEDKTNNKYKAIDKLLFSKEEEIYIVIVG